MLAKCTSVNCLKFSDCKRASSQSTANVDYVKCLCDESNGYKWFVEVEREAEGSGENE
jgi:hypothetical protein